LDFVFKSRQRLQLSQLQDRKRFDDSVTQGRKKIRPALARRLEDVARKLAMVRALLDQDEVVDLTESFPDFRELSGQQLTEERADAHICVVVSTPPNRAPTSGIISARRMIKRLLHEPGEGNRAARANCFANKLNEFSLQSENVQCPTRVRKAAARRRPTSNKERMRFDSALDVQFL